MKQNLSFYSLSIHFPDIEEYKFILSKGLCYVFGYAEFKTVTKEVCKLPTFLSSAIFRKIDTGCSGIVTRYAVNVI